MGLDSMTSQSLSFSLRTLGSKGLDRATVPPTQGSSPHPGMPRQVSCLGTTNPLASRGWVAWQLLLVGLGGLAPPGLSVGDQAAGSQHHPHPQHQLKASHPPESPGRSRGGHPAVTPIGCRPDMLSAHGPCGPRKVGDMRALLYVGKLSLGKGK